MAKNNQYQMANIREELDKELLTQPFAEISVQESCLEHGKRIALLYAEMENCISVLSDMKTRKSYIYYGVVAQEFGLSQGASVIETIWEDHLLSLVNSEDLQKKYQVELQFFQFLNSIEIDARLNYEVVTKLRTKTTDGQFAMLQHRLRYLTCADERYLSLALCLYQKVPRHPAFNIPDAVIINRSTGQVIDCNQNKLAELLSFREKEVLQLMKCGCPSKEIAHKLALSIYTVHRHRQNIFKKLNVTNVVEACRVADGAGLL